MDGRCWGPVVQWTVGAVAGIAAVCVLVTCELVKVPGILYVHESQRTPISRTYDAAVEKIAVGTVLSLPAMQMLVRCRALRRAGHRAALDMMYVKHIAICVLNIWRYKIKMRVGYHHVIVKTNATDHLCPS